MKIKGKKRYLTVTKEDVSKFIEYILIARNAYIDDDVPVEDVNDLLFRFLKLKGGGIYFRGKNSSRMHSVRFL